MNVLSFFDGMSCGRIALERAGIEVTNYFACEIDKYAIQVSKHNYDDITHLGDVTKVEVLCLPKIDLLIGRSPCQGFSFAGKQLNFNDPRSKLFFEFVRVLKDIQAYNPDVLFFLENVVMKKEYQEIISSHLGVKPILINSALVSAQNRKRLYWTNLPFYAQPEDKGIFLKDILETPGSGMIRNLGTYHARNDKGMGLVANYSKGADNHGMRTIIQTGCLQVGIAEDVKGFEMTARVYSPEGKSPTVRSTTGGGAEPPKVAIMQKARGFNKGGLHEDKSPPITSNSWQENNKLTNGITYRKLTPVKCERLQTVPDNYTSCVSNTQRYKMLGNGWNVDTIVHFFRWLKIIDEL